MSNTNESFPFITAVDNLIIRKDVALESSVCMVTVLPMSLLTNATFLLCNFLYVFLLGDNDTVEYLEEVPIQALGDLKGYLYMIPIYIYMHIYMYIYCHYCMTVCEYIYVGLTGHEKGEIIVFNFEYGKDYSGPGYLNISNILL